MKKILSLSACLLLAACGGSGSDGDSSDSPSLSDISGIYDSGSTEDGITDEMYLVIRSNGTWTEYDYAGDEFDQGANCYVVADFGEIEGFENGEFELYSDGLDAFTDVEIALVDDSLEVTSAEGDTVSSFPSSTKVESEFTSQLCSEMP